MVKQVVIVWRFQSSRPGYTPKEKKESNIHIMVLNLGVGVVLVYVHDIKNRQYRMCIFAISKILTTY